MKTKISVSKGLEVTLKILKLIKKRKDLLCDVSIGAFTNCRECGLTYMVTEGNFNDWFTFCTYEHRNSDKIIINGAQGLISMNGELPYNGDSKWDYLASFEYNDYEGAVDKLVELINEKVTNANMG